VADLIPAGLSLNIEESFGDLSKADKGVLSLAVEAKPFIDEILPVARALTDAKAEDKIKANSMIAFRFLLAKRKEQDSLDVATQKLRAQYEVPAPEKAAQTAVYKAKEGFLNKMVAWADFHFAEDAEGREEFDAAWQSLYALLPQGAAK
jgi:hypothetical protein